MSVDWVGYGYAALIASGGAIGYVKAGRPILCVEKGGRIYAFQVPHYFLPDYNDIC